MLIIGSYTCLIQNYNCLNNKVIHVCQIRLSAVEVFGHMDINTIFIGQYEHTSYKIGDTMNLNHALDFSLEQGHIILTYYNIYVYSI